MINPSTPPGIPSRYRLVIFDFDGTICDTRHSISHCVVQTFQNFKAAPPSEELVEGLIGQGLTLTDTFKQLVPGYFDEKPAELDQWITTYRQIYQVEGQARIQAYEGTKDLFEHLKGYNVTSVVISNKGEAAIQTAIANFSLASYVDMVIGDREGIKNKPHPDVFTNLIQPKYDKISKQEILMVGDTESDILFAQAIGVDVCWARYGYGHKEKCTELKPTFAIDSIKALETHLAK